MRFRYFFVFLATFVAVLGHVMKREVEAGLTSLLSPGASLYYPGSEGFTKSNERFTELNRPDYQVVVHVATEEDVVATVCLQICLEISFPLVTGECRSNMPQRTISPSSPNPAAMV